MLQAIKIFVLLQVERWQSGRMRRSWKPLRVTPPGVRIPLSPQKSERRWKSVICKPQLLIFSFLLRQKRDKKVLDEISPVAFTKCRFWKKFFQILQEKSKFKTYFFVIFTSQFSSRHFFTTFPFHSSISLLAATALKNTSSFSMSIIISIKCWQKEEKFSISPKFDLVHGVWEKKAKNGNPHIFDIKLTKTLFFFTIFQPFVTQYFALDIIVSL